MKKFVALFLFLCVINFCGTAFADGVKIGVLSNALSEDDFKVAYGNVIKWSVFDKGHGENDSLHFYENFSSMLMALNAGEINEIRLPKPVAEYVLNTNPDYKISCVSRTNQANFVFGFLKGEGIIHQKNFNYALRQMKKNGSLDALKRLYFIDAVKNDPVSVQFDSFPKSEKTIRVAVTGDIPPIDFIAPDGKPAGFSTAVLSEIGRILKMNIETVNIDTASRSAALASGRVDVVFWYCMFDEEQNSYDIPENVIVSEPYYDWDMFVDIVKK